MHVFSLFIFELFNQKTTNVFFGGGLGKFVVIIYYFWCAMCIRFSMVCLFCSFVLFLFSGGGGGNFLYMYFFYGSNWSYSLLFF